MKEKYFSWKKLLVNRKIRRGGLFVGVLALSIAVIVLFLKPKVEVISDHAFQEKKIRPVSVISVEPEAYFSTIIGYGEVRPVWELALRSKVDGYVVELSKRFKVGMRVEKGEFLVQLNKVATQALVADAALQLDRARVELLVEEKESSEALESWKRANFGDVQPSPLVLRKPYLDLAQSNLLAAESNLNHAEQQLDFTTVKSPFDALIVSREISLGGDVFAGDVLCTIVGTEKSEIALHVDKRQWEQFPEDWDYSIVDIVDPDLGFVWKGRLVRDGSHYDQDSRLRTVFVEIENPLDQTPALLPGNFVEVHIEGKSIDGLLRVPESARNQKGFIWLVGDEELLKSYSVVPEFQRDGFLFVRSPVAGVAQVVVNPNNSFVDGLQVTPCGKEL